MSRHLCSPRQVFPGGKAKRRLQAHPLGVERLEERCLLTAGYQQTNLVSDIPGLARHTDPNLVNPWGITASPDGQLRISDNGTGLSTLYTSNGTALPKVVTIPPPLGSPPGTTAAPTGIVLNITSDFVIGVGHKARPSTFIFATEDGTLSGWNPDVNRTNAILTVPASGAVFKGLALGRNAQGNFLFATDFHNGTVDVFNKNFQQVKLAGSFVDPQLPPPPIGSPGFAPFGIQNIGGNLFVSYALQKPGQHDDQAGPGNGFVDVFDTSGNLLRRFASKGTLNSPWGMAVAPDDFGQFSHALLIGNFGDGRINAFNRTTGTFLGQLSNTAGQPITIDGLWGITFSGREEDDSGTLFFAAGINDEADGLFGTLKPAQPDGPARRPASTSGRPEIGGEIAAFVALSPPLPDARSPDIQSSLATPADPTNRAGGHSVVALTPRLMDAGLVRTDSREVIDRAFGDFQTNAFGSVLGNDLASTFATL
jgi:uncharacterized protein (TIGR03118 family)